MISVSDHALIRFMERGAGVDVEAVRAGMAQALDRASRAAERIGQPDHLIVVDDLVFIVRDATVVTVLDRCSRAGRAAILRRPVRTAG